jgi:hypothetical protein
LTQLSQTHGKLLPNKVTFPIHCGFQITIKVEAIFPGLEIVLLKNIAYKIQKI